MPNPNTGSDQAILDLIAYFAKRDSLLLPRLLQPPKKSAKRRRFSDSDLLRPIEAARILKVRPKTLANWRVSGVGPKFTRLGGAIVYRYSELQAFIAKGSRASTSDKGDAQ
ncbi:MAG: DNA-binding protein [Mesorhizobium sp.]|uniref:helix-turn-helix domain-containing protein n=1 Tax=Mesorhizobium sp. TaxID=1871066 RepID=UPI000FE8D56D|nr:helix-turn-helix domain-containing protein [Mesorhizobium sp.]RWH69496.1 MAG: DNA-binding protein [Mesorhizobium sp.]RWH76362.1 MAG: DNA-binding protein [Mesorhizobium sp.]RWH83508.1 MAG: DNA-binding protein [Mesorhizobium sp.]RWH91525.1 MAG: DNA-binding protein [Mesorhizobium sp.]RWH95798.1 MAG: DNA-binding protein [Mesorhizobium sp.]